VACNCERENLKVPHEPGCPDAAALEHHPTAVHERSTVVCSICLKECSDWLLTPW
jgi:hypothetical protein